MSSVPEIAIQPILNELPPGRNDHHSRSRRIARLENQVGDLVREREGQRRSIAMLADLNRSLGNSARKVTFALHQQMNGVPAELEYDLTVPALLWDLQRREGDCVYLTDMTISQKQIIESQSHHITLLTRQVSDLQQALGQSIQGHSVRETQRMQGMQRVSISDDPRIRNVH